MEGELSIEVVVAGHGIRIIGAEPKYPGQPQISDLPPSDGDLIEWPRDKIASLLQPLFLG